MFTQKFEDTCGNGARFLRSKCKATVEVQHITSAQFSFCMIPIRSSHRLRPAISVNTLRGYFNYIPLFEKKAARHDCHGVYHMQEAPVVCTAKVGLCNMRWSCIHVCTSRLNPATTGVEGENYAGQ